MLPLMTARCLTTPYFSPRPSSINDNLRSMDSFLCRLAQCRPPDRGGTNDSVLSGLLVGLSSDSALMGLAGVRGALSHLSQSSSLLTDASSSAMMRGMRTSIDRCFFKFRGENETVVSGTSRSDRSQVVLMGVLNAFAAAGMCF
mmetsp:Transcript_17075/g.30524  ORF Transcript_17075/g.30524 Transcript_17075/m.30524 type:complete len:144 (+) Transcript_17075:71-502(+)